jgi:5'-nucleotidase
MKAYEWILFDADETLFHFDSFTGLQRTIAAFGSHFTEQDYQDYQVINKALWTNYQNSKITAKQLQHQRFNRWADRLNVSPQSLNSAFLSTMADISTPLEGARSLLNSLKDKIKLGIITNGFTELQKARLERTELKNHFDIVVISEEVGFAKPHPGIFNHALTKMGSPARTQVLMVGDTLESDIQGGINAGLDTCWLNRNNRIALEDIRPNYQVSSLKELEALLLKSM